MLFWNLWISVLCCRLTFSSCLSGLKGTEHPQNTSPLISGPRLLLGSLGVPCLFLIISSLTPTTSQDSSCFGLECTVPLACFALILDEEGTLQGSGVDISFVFLFPRRALQVILYWWTRVKAAGSCSCVDCVLLGYVEMVHGSWVHRQLGGKRCSAGELNLSLTCLWTIYLLC